MLAFFCSLKTSYKDCTVEWTDKGDSYVQAYPTAYRWLRTIRSCDPKRNTVRQKHQRRGDSLSCDPAIPCPLPSDGDTRGSEGAVGNLKVRPSTSWASLKSR